jgi:uncharacterized protein (DUF1800 family)
MTPFSEISMSPKAAWAPFQATAENPWSPRLAAHLFRRATFGASIARINESVVSGLDATLDQLFDLSEAAPFEEEVAVAGRMLASNEESRGLSAWWLLRMVQTPCPLLEKMTLFWHGHFATGGDKVLDSRAMLNQNKLLREHALGRFEPLVQGISKDPAMLIYLDSTENRKTRPNENYARELLELFCLGPGNYSETDIKELARCFTGWEVRGARFRFNEHQFDSKSKSFFGNSGNLSGEQAVRAVLDHDACPLFVAKKLIRFFVFDAQEITDEFAQPVADQLRESNFDIAATLRVILGSQFFFSENSIARKIKSPVELAVGTLKFFDATSNMNQITRRLERLGQLPFYPPNVKGWDGGTSWINASTIIARANLVADLFASSSTRLEAGDLKSWYRRSRKTLSQKDFAGLSMYWMAGPLTEETTKVLELVSDKPRDLLVTVASLPEYQLN